MNEILFEAAVSNPSQPRLRLEIEDRSLKLVRPVLRQGRAIKDFDGRWNRKCRDFFVTRIRRRRSAAKPNNILHRYCGSLGGFVLRPSVGLKLWNWRTKCWEMAIEELTHGLCRFAKSSIGHNFSDSASKGLNIWSLYTDLPRDNMTVERFSLCSGLGQSIPSLM
jgi:hypothetical protein